MVPSTRVQERLGGLPFTLDDLPAIGDVPAGADDLLEARLRANQALRTRPATDHGLPATPDEWKYAPDELSLFEGLGDLPSGPLPPGAADDLLHSTAGLAPPGVADFTAMPRASDYYHLIGDPNSPSAPYLATDALLDNLGPESIQGAHAGAWDDVLGRLDPLHPDLRAAVGRDPEWRPALLTRLAELAAVRDNARVVHLPPDLTPTLERQFDALHDLLGVSPADYTWASGRLDPDRLQALLPPGGASPENVRRSTLGVGVIPPPAPPQLMERLSAISLLRQLSEAEHLPHDFASSTFTGRMYRKIGEQNPMLMPDLDAARQIAADEVVDNTARTLTGRVHQNLVAHDDLIDPADVPWLGAVVAHGTSEYPRYAVQGMLRTRPETREPYADLLAALEHFMGLPFGTHPTVSPVQGDDLMAAYNRLAIKPVYPE